MPDIRKQFRPFIALFILLVAVSCSRSPAPAPEPTETPLPTPTLAQPQVRVTAPPDAQAAAEAYLGAWKAEDYSSMYALLGAESQEQMDEETFTARYRGVMAEAAVNDIAYQLYPPVVQPHSAQIAYEVILNSVLVGELHSATSMELVMEGSAWRIKWDEGLIMSELRDGGQLRMVYSNSERANIYDRNGAPLAAVMDAVALGLMTGQIDTETENSMLEAIFRATGILPDSLRPRINAYRGNDWYIPLTDLAADALAPYLSSLSSYSAIYRHPFQARYYYAGASAAHVVGYSSLIQEAEVERYKRLGYNWTSKVGRSGLELWGENYLSGTRGGRLELVSPNGETVTLAERPAGPSQEIVSTIDRSLQMQVQRALGDFTGAIVVMERDTGRVLAMASSPSYNPNVFDANNFNRREETLNAISNPTTRPLLNRASEGRYPLGSVFKIITMATALESGLFTPESEYYCDYFFTELQGIQLKDWTYDRFLKDDKTPPSGQLTLPEGLMRSCNPWFYKIGMTLYDSGFTTAISDIARGFGLGSLTGIEIGEVAGQIPDPKERLDGTNIAIGQGDVQVTPLQVAAFVAAVGNGGVLYEPHIVERAGPEYAPSYLFSPTVKGNLPVRPENLTVIQDAMLSVVNNSRGTANHVLGAFSRNYRIPIAGKTGTAEIGGGSEPHSWFAGYTDAGRPNQPDIAVAVLVESIGEGSEFAAPIFKRVMEIYFTGSPRSTYPWESSIGIKRTPTPDPTATPIVEETPTPEAGEELEETPTPEP